MKFIIACCSILTTYFAVMAQTDDQAEKILDRVTKQYQTFQTISADFSYTIENTESNINETEKGTIWLKGNKYKLKISGQEIFNDGSNVWVYLKDVNEVNVTKFEPMKDEVTPSNIFTIYKQGFKRRFVEEVTQKGTLFEVIELTPIDADKQIFKIKLFIDKHKTLLASIQMFDRNGSHYTYSIDSFKPNETLSDNFFTFDKSAHPNVHIEDLR